MERSLGEAPALDYHKLDSPHKQINSPIWVIGFVTPAALSAVLLPPLSQWALRRLLMLIGCRRPLDD